MFRDFGSLEGFVANANRMGLYITKLSNPSQITLGIGHQPFIHILMFQFAFLTKS